MNRTVPVVLLLAAVVLTGCGDGAEEEADPTPPPTAPATVAATEPADAEADAPPEPAERTYRVREGDTLSAIAQRFDTTVRALARLNDIEDPNEIRIGQELQVPAGG